MNLLFVVLSVTDDDGHEEVQRWRLRVAARGATEVFKEIKFVVE